MTDHLSFEQLCDFTDGALGAADEGSARAHLRACEECASRLAALSALSQSTAVLPREIAPPDGLWNDIRKELKPRYGIGRGRVTTWRARQLAAAALVIAMGSSALTALMLRNRRVLPDREATVARVAPPVELPARLASVEHGYTRSADELQRTLDERRDSLAPSTIATVERSLRVADSAIAEARDALARDPANRALAALFASNYERKIDLLRRATMLDPRT